MSGDNVGEEKWFMIVDTKSLSQFILILTRVPAFVSNRSSDLKETQILRGVQIHDIFCPSPYMRYPFLIFFYKAGYMLSTT